jgi:hypothetical protein
MAGLFWISLRSIKVPCYIGPHALLSGLFPARTFLPDAASAAPNLDCRRASTTDVEGCLADTMATRVTQLRAIVAAKIFVK